MGSIIEGVAIKAGRKEGFVGAGPSSKSLPLNVVAAMTEGNHIKSGRTEGTAGVQQKGSLLQKRSDIYLFRCLRLQS